MPADEALIARLEDERYAAMLGGDVMALDRLLHDDLVYAHSSGVTDSKASYIAGVRGGVWTYRRAHRSEQTILAHEAFALVFNRLRMDIAVTGAPKELDNKALAVWAPSADGWQLLALQSAAVLKHEPQEHRHLSIVAGSPDMIPSAAIARVRPA